MATRFDARNFVPNRSFGSGRPTVNVEAKRRAAALRDAMYVEAKREDEARERINAYIAKMGITLESK